MTTRTGMGIGIYLIITYIDWLLKMGCHLSVRCHFNKQNRINDMLAFEHNWQGSLDVAIMFLAAVQNSKRQWLEVRIRIRSLGD